MTFRLALAAAGTSALFAGLPAHAQSVTGDRSVIVAELARLGVQTTPGDYVAGRYKLKANTDGIEWEIWSYDCSDDGNSCQSVQFWTGFNDPDIGVNEINDWNRDWRYCRAYIGRSGSAYVESDVVMNGAGISQAAFEGAVSAFLECQKRYQAYVYRQ